MISRLVKWAQISDFYSRFFVERYAHENRSGGILEDCDIDVYDLEGNPEHDDNPVGTLTVSISAGEVLKALKIK